MEQTPNLTLGQSLYGESRLAEAEETFRRVIGEEPENPDGHFRLGLVLKDEAKLSDARAALGRGLALSEERGLPLRSRSILPTMKLISASAGSHWRAVTGPRPSDISRRRCA